jgi:hypothetical protein
LQLPNLGFEFRAIVIALCAMLFDFACERLCFGLGALNFGARSSQFLGKSIAVRAEPFDFPIGIGVREPKPIDLRLEQIVRHAKRLKFGLEGLMLRSQQFDLLVALPAQLDGRGGAPLGNGRKTTRLRSR